MSAVNVAHSNSMAARPASMAARVRAIGTAPVRGIAHARGTAVVMVSSCVLAYPSSGRGELGKGEGRGGIA
jgi:hypothetical protein